MGVKWRAVGGLLAASLLLGAGLVHATLSVQPQGTVYDSVQDISWDQDGNAVKTLCDANDAIWQTFDPRAVTNNSGRSKAQICGEDGTLNWYEAEAWVAHLNTQVYKDITNWRQWAVTQPDPNCSSQTTDTPPQGFAYRCTGSEMGHLFYVAAPDGLGNPNELDDGCAPNCLQNTGPFAGFRESVYWSGTEYVPKPRDAWRFEAGNGFQGGGSFSKRSLRYVWAVRPGQVARSSQPEPIPAAGMWGLGLLGLLLMLLARARLR